MNASLEPSRWQSSLTLVAAIALAAGLAAPASSDSWTRVGTGGLGDPMNPQADAMATVGDWIYVATHGQFDLLGHTFRADVGSDTVWTEHSPPFDGPDEVSDLEGFRDDLYAATKGGRLWRLGAEDDVWQDVTPDWGPESPSILALVDYRSAITGQEFLLLVRSGLELWRSEDPGVVPFTSYLMPPILRDQPDLQSATLFATRAALYLGVGGSTAESAVCQVWVHTLHSLDWSPLTTDCFERPLGTWALSIHSFEGRVYFGTGGHGGAGMFRDRGDSWEEVSPLSIYSPGLRDPIRYQTMAVVGSKLYTGVRSFGGMGGDVIATDDGTDWEFSNTPGFGEGLSQDAVTALTGHEAWLYAGTFNSDTGFQIWRRNPSGLETLPWQLDDLRHLTQEVARLPKCLLPALPRCGFDLKVLFDLLGSLNLRFQRLELDSVPAKVALAVLSQSELEFLRAKEAADLALKAPSHAEAQKLRAEAVGHLHRGRQWAHQAVFDFAQAVAVK